jgi:hypothetical protein
MALQKRRPSEAIGCGLLVNSRDHCTRWTGSRKAERIAGFGTRIVLLATATSLVPGRPLPRPGPTRSSPKGMRRAGAAWCSTPPRRTTGSNSGADPSSGEAAPRPGDRGRWRGQVGARARGGRSARCRAGRLPGIVGRRRVPGRAPRAASEHTAKTAAISGRPARFLANPFTAPGAGVEGEPCRPTPSPTAGQGTARRRQGGEGLWLPRAGSRAGRAPHTHPARGQVDRDNPKRDASGVG